MSHKPRFVVSMTSHYGSHSNEGASNICLRINECLRRPGHGKSLFSFLFAALGCLHLIEEVRWTMKSRDRNQHLYNSWLHQRSSRALLPVMLYQGTQVLSAGAWS